MKVIRTEQIFIRGNGTVSTMCHISKNLFNQTNYILRNQFFSKEKTAGYKDLENVAEKVAPFGWDVITIDGNSLNEVVSALEDAKKTKGKADVPLLLQFFQFLLLLLLRLHDPAA